MPSTQSALVTRLLDGVHALRRCWQDQRQLRAMSELDLRDLGVGRSEIPWLLSDAAAPPHAPRSRARCAADARPARRP